MAALDTAVVAFNRGIVSKLALARTDIKRVAFSCSRSDNWISRVLGSMMLRPGLGYIGEISNDYPARCIPHIFGTNDCSLLEFTDSTMRVWINDVLLTRPAVSTLVTNGTFAGNIAGWTDSSDGGASIAYLAANRLKLQGANPSRARATQSVSVAPADSGYEHALRITVDTGPVTLLVGSAIGQDDYVSKTTLDTGTHSIAFKPTSDFTIEFQSTQLPRVLISNCTIESAGAVSLPTPWDASELGLLRYDQSADVVFISCKGTQQRQIERRGTRPGARSWSVALYKPNDGPFFLLNQGPITLLSSAGTGPGNGVLTASAPLFKTSHVGALFSLTLSGQTVGATCGAALIFTSAIEVTGVGTTRAFRISLASLTATGDTVSLQQSFGGSTGPWTTIQTYTANGLPSYNDTLDNQFVWYRIGIEAGNYAAGAPVVSLLFNGGTSTGIFRVSGFTSSTSVTTEVLAAVGSTASTDWREGQWSDKNGWPNAASFYEGRLWWSGQNGVWGSVSDNFPSFNDAMLAGSTVLGDSGPINRTVGSGPVDTINWIMPLQRLLLGAEGSELSCRSTSFDEPLTPSNFNIKVASSQGSAPVSAVKIDNRAAYVQRGGFRIFELSFDLQTYEYQSTHLTALCPDLGSNDGTSGTHIVRMAVQRQPDTRILAVRSDGVVMVGIFDKVEEVLCWETMSSTGAGGVIEDVSVLPAQTGQLDDNVYFVVARTIGGVTKRYLEKMAMEVEAKGGTVSKIADAFVVYDGRATGTYATVITGLGHLEGKQVVVWADGKDVGTNDNRTLIYTVAAAQITLATPALYVVAGLPYSAPWRSVKLGQAISGMGTALTKQKKIDQLAVVMADVHPKGLRYGPDFNNLDELPEVYQGQDLRAAGLLDTIIDEYDDQNFVFMGEWQTDARLCIQADAPRPVTIMAAVINHQIKT